MRPRLTLGTKWENPGMGETLVAPEPARPCLGRALPDLIELAPDYSSDLPLWGCDGSGNIAWSGSYQAMARGQTAPNLESSGP